MNTNNTVLEEFKKYLELPHYVETKPLGSESPKTYRQIVGFFDEDGKIYSHLLDKNGELSFALSSSELLNNANILQTDNLSKTSQKKHTIYSAGRTTAGPVKTGNVVFMMGIGKKPWILGTIEKVFDNTFRMKVEMSNLEKTEDEKTGTFGNYDYRIVHTYKDRGSDDLPDGVKFIEEFNKENPSSDHVRVRELFRKTWREISNDYPRKLPIDPSKYNDVTKLKDALNDARPDYDNLSSATQVVIVQKEKKRTTKPLPTLNVVKGGGSGGGSNDPPFRPTSSTKNTKPPPLPPPAGNQPARPTTFKPITAYPKMDDIALDKIKKYYYTDVSMNSTQDTRYRIRLQFGEKEVIFQIFKQKDKIRPIVYTFDTKRRHYVVDIAEGEYFDENQYFGDDSYNLEDIRYNNSSIFTEGNGVIEMRLPIKNPIAMLVIFDKNKNERVPGYIAFRPLLVENTEL